MALFSKKKQIDMPRRRAVSRDADHPNNNDFEERYSFRRNRTLTGSTSSQIVSTSESNAQIKSPRAQAHELTKQRRRIGAILLLVLGVAAIIYGLLSQFTAGVVVHASDLSIRLDPEYEKVIQAYLSSQPIERLRFLTNLDHLDQYIQEKMPEVASVSIDGSAGFGKTSFILSLREPTVGWSINGHQEYVDNTGTSFDRNYFPSPAVQVIDKSGVQVQAGQAIASNRFLGFVGRAVGLTKARGFTVLQVIIPEGTTRQVELQLRGISYPVKFSIDRGVDVQVEDMVRAIGWLQAHVQSLEYLDVRVSGEAFYR